MVLFNGGKSPLGGGRLYFAVFLRCAQKDGAFCSALPLAPCSVFLAPRAEPRSVFERAVYEN